MLQLRPYQEELSTKATELLQKYKFVLLSMEVRTGKTFTALATIKKYGAKKILFLTKKKAISGIKGDCEHFKDDYDIVIINYESMHQIKENDFDLIVLDESHQLGSYPKPNKKFKDIKERFGQLPMILLSGTASPESFSQFFHQFFVSYNGPWKEYRNFYSWSKKFVEIGIVYTSYGQSKDYSNADYDMIMKDIGHLILTYTQKEAGFNAEIEEKVMFVTMKPKTYQIVNTLMKDKLVEGGEEVILADTMVKEMQKLHQLYSGTIKFESGNTQILDYSKGLFIRDQFKGKKIGIFYNFKAEKDLLKKVFGDTITDDLDEFNSTDKNIMLQIVSGREGISLKKADFLVYYNIAFSALSYWQSRDRLTTIERQKNTVYWIFSRGGIEEKIYNSVQEKKSFTKKIYERTRNSN